jgi:hypothetical protein
MGSSGYEMYDSAEYGADSIAKGGFVPPGIPGPTGSIAPGVQERDVIKNATLELLVGNADKAADDMRFIAAQFGGIVETIELSQAEGGPLPMHERSVTSGPNRGYIIIRVPDTQFDNALIAVKSVALDVEHESVSARDVTGQVLDFEARLSNLRAEEKQYQQIMDSAGTVEETLNVASRLYDVRGRIESMEAQLAYLQQEVAMSTITTYLTVENDVQVLGFRWKPLLEVRASVQNLLEDLAGFANFLIAFVIRLPILLLWLATGLLILWVGFRLYRFFRKLARAAR